MSREIIDFTGHPKKSEEDLLKEYCPDLLLIIDQVLSSKKTFQIIFQDLIDIMKYGFEKEEIRHMVIHFKFHKKDKTVYPMQMNHFIANLIFWQPLIMVDAQNLLDGSWIFDLSKFNSKTLMAYINDRLLPLYDTDFATQNAMVDDLYHYILCISHAFCLLMGMGVSLYDLHQLELRDPAISHIMRDPVDQSMEPHEIEELLNARNKELIDRIIQDPVGNDYKPFFASGTGLKEAQFREYIVKIGFKADINGNTVPILIDNNFLFDGLTKPSYIYLNAISGRKSLILTKLSMGRPGSLAKKLSYVSLTSQLKDDMDVCDSVEQIIYHITSPDMLELLHGRYYYTPKGELKLLDATKDKDLIGKVLRFRSPVTCNSKDGVCRQCYGHMFNTNQSLFSAGTLAALKITEPIGQAVLSSKHSQSTHSASLQMTDDFDKNFEVSNSTIVLKEDGEFDSVAYLKLGPVCIEESDDSEAYYVTYFDIVDEKGNMIRHIEEASGAKFYLNDKILQMYKAKLKTRSAEAIFPMEDIDDSEALFTIEIKNKELTEPLKIFTKVLNSKDHGGAKTLSELCQEFAEDLIKMGIKYELVHAEMIIRALIRKKTNILEYPEFGVGGNPRDFQILKLDDALLNNPSALLGMSAGYLKKALVSPDLYEKTATGPLDALAVPRLSDYLTA